MKKMIFGAVLVLLAGVLVSCASGPYKPLSGISNAEVLGTVQATFEFQHYYNIPDINGAAYIALLENAKKEYQGNIDVCDVTWVRGRSVKGWNMYETIANGKVVLLGGSNRSTATTGVEGALERAAIEVSGSFTARSRIAIVYITAQDRSTTDFISGELEHTLRQKGFVIIDRSELDRIRAEQRFGATGEVDDATAARIGNIAGASIVITGRVDGEGNLRRLRLRALNTTSAQVVGTASERL